MQKAIIIEDEIRSRALLQDLVMANCEGVEIVALAGNVAEAVEAIKLHQPDLLFLDIELQTGTGFEVLQQLRADPAYKSLPVVVLTTSNHREDEAKAMELGANAFLTKPGSSGKLLMLFGQLVQQWKIS
ncbi:MAG: response regulator [Cytophagaceae bacterium]|nr:MAG: response regulator [Cytophagaceae bacterium]